MKKFISTIIFFIVLQILIVYFAVKNLSLVRSVIPLSGPYAHFGAFFMTSFFLAMILTHEFVQIKYPFIISFVYSTIFAIIIELIQLKIPYRHFSYEDIFVGMIGALVFCLIFRYLAKRSHFVHKIFYAHLDFKHMKLVE